MLRQRRQLSNYKYLGVYRIQIEFYRAFCFLFFRILMAGAHALRIQSCSGCLIEAIECHDEVGLRNPLSAMNMEYSDTYWVPRAKILEFVALFQNSFKDFPVLTHISKHQSSHLLVEETLVTGETANIAMSVLLSSMLHS